MYYINNFEHLLMSTKLANPFVITGRIPAEYFCDRVEETKRIVRVVTNEGNIVLMSPRRMGKSRLVQHCLSFPAISEHYNTFYIDLLHTSSLREFTYIFGKTVFKSLTNFGQKVMLSFVQALQSLSGTFGLDASTGLPTFTIEISRIVSPEFTLGEIFSWLESVDIPSIICFDEFQQISNYPENKNGEVEALLRSHIQHMRNARFIYSGSERHLLMEMFFTKAKPFYNSADQLNLKSINIDVYADFASSMFRAYGKDIDEEVVRKYFNKLDGTTYYIQKLMHESFIDCASGEKCNESVVEAALQSIIEEKSDNFDYMLGTLTERQKDALFAIAKEEQADHIMSVAFIKKHGIATPSVMQTAVNKLLQMDLITVENGVYSVSDILLRIYLQSIR